jgi:hypothetical protein
MILFLRLDLPGDLNGYQFTGFRQAFNVQRSTFNVQRLAGAGCSQDIGNSFALSPAALLLGFARPKLYERLSLQTAERQTLNAER